MERLGAETERYLRAVVEGQPIWVRMQQGLDQDAAAREAVTGSAQHSSCVGS